MGIIKAAAGSLGGIMADQWLEMFYCEGMPNDVLAQRGSKRTGDNSSNTKGDENVISDGSVIAVNDGQCALAIEQGKIIGVYAAPGEHVFRSDKSGSVFSGGGLGNLAKQAVDRIGFGGDVAVHQFIMYLDMKEHMDNAFSLQVPVRGKDSNTGLDADVTATVSGVFSFQITDPLIFYKNICGNRTSPVYKSYILPQLTAELQSLAAAALAQLCAEGVRPSQLPSQTETLCEKIESAATEKWQALRGFRIFSLAIDSLALTQGDAGMFKEASRTKMLTDPAMAAATLTEATATAMKTAAGNTAGGGLGVFAGLNLTAPIGGIVQKSASSAQSGGLWRCTCGSMNTTNFCENCGAKRPQR